MQRYDLPTKSFIISERELDELQEFFVSDIVPKRAMTFDMLDGFFTTLVIGPNMPPMSEWLPRVWDVGDMMATPRFHSVSHEQRITMLLVKMLNSLDAMLRIAPELYHPLFMTMKDDDDDDDDWRSLLVTSWATGFVIGILTNDNWMPLVQNPTLFEAMCLPIYLLSAMSDKSEKHPTKTREELIEDIPDTVLSIREFWLPIRPQNEETDDTVRVRSVGRNDLCPCGSGKKFKKCCGQ